MGRPRVDFEVVAVFDGVQAARPSCYKAVIITGSSAMVSDHAEWVERTAGWLQEAVLLSVPTLGICFGHQLLAYALGGEVADNPAGVEVGTVEVTMSHVAQDDLLLGGMKTIAVQASHRQSVSRLPEQAECLAATTMDENHAFCVNDRCWGLQFHPEFNADITRHYIDYYHDELESVGRETETMKRGCAETQQAGACLKKFSQQIEKWEQV